MNFDFSLKFKVCLATACAHGEWFFGGGCDSCLTVG